jgi:hypothetical protein
MGSRVITAPTFHVRLALFACGLGTVNVTNLVKLFDAMHTELRQLVPAAMPLAARAAR